MVYFCVFVLLIILNTIRVLGIIPEFISGPQLLNGVSALQDIADFPKPPEKISYPHPADMEYYFSEAQEAPVKESSMLKE
ncbi:hypothetical protein MUK42_14022 [Musa troglodytarum]|uniref:Uncharacterized protein n=1 Tax=Musa troglodytarum TaxID=320322 RepID=A0A9E7KSS8_9LILI|nr:hypothetical protein MUK42_14022 [Musa troglodytarum]